ncbi:unnamed protein product [Rotaria sp. Silwood1]|nr:unnamed protein product [Rotaria sp. Silwood1]
MQVSFSAVALILVTTTLGFRWSTIGTTIAGTGYSVSPLSSRLYSPRKIRFDSSGLLYIADQLDHRIQAWKVGDSAGATVAGQANGVAGSTSTDLYNPFSSYVDSSNNIYVADTYNHRVQLWSSGALSGTTLIGTADTDNHRIMSYTSGASSGAVVIGGNGPGTVTNQLYSPHGIYFDSSSNSLLIANFGTHTIVRWTIGSTRWTLVAGSIGYSGSTSITLSGPSDVTLDSMGNIYVADTNNNRVQLFFAGQRNATTIAGVTGTIGNSYTLLNAPRSIVLDQQLNLYVSDTSNHRIQMFIRY